MGDLDRIGLFKEMSYISIGTPFKEMKIHNFSGKNFIVPGSKVPCANIDGYFNEFQRMFDGERGITSFIDLRRKWRLEGNSKIIGKNWIPNSSSIKLPGFGSRIGSFQPPITAFGTLTQSYPYIHEKKNFLTSPAQKGSGYGYNNICFNRYPEYIMGNKYNDFESIYKKSNEFHEGKVAGRPKFIPSNGYGGYFTENPYIGGSTETWPAKNEKKFDKPFIVASYPKKDGGMGAGTFNPYPANMPCPYSDPSQFLIKDVINDQGKRFLPNNNFPTYFPTNSVLQQNVNFRCNNTNIGKVSTVY